MDRLAWLIFPLIENTLDKAPGSFYFIATCEECRVTHHTVENQAFVGLRLSTLKGRAIIKIHVDGANLHLRAGDFGAKLERNAFIGLHTHGEGVCLNLAVC